MAIKQAKRLDEEFMKAAKTLGLLDQKHFRQAVESYNFQVKLAEILRERIEKEGTTIWIPVGKDREKLASNPAVSDLNKCETLAKNLRAELDTKLKTALENREAENDTDL